MTTACLRKRQRYLSSRADEATVKPGGEEALCYIRKVDSMTVVEGVPFALAVEEPGG